MRSNGVIGREPLRLAAGGDPRRHLGSQAGQLSAALGTEPADVEHQPAAHAHLALNGQPGQLLQRLQRLALVTDQRSETLADDRDDRALALDIHVEVAIEVEDVEQRLEVVRRDIAFLDEVGRLGAG